MGFFNIMTVVSFVVLIFSVILHEIMHGYAADRLGDPTARLLGRLTLNPIPHIDRNMTILLPLLMFILTQGTFYIAGAKPVPVDPYNLKDGRKDLALVSVAGPLTNLALATIAAIIFKLIFRNVPVELLFSPFFVPSSALQFIAAVLVKIVSINTLLAVFNLIPIPPLDGSKLFALLLPERDAQAFLSIGNLGMLILIFLLQFPIGPFSLQDVIFRVYAYILTVMGF